MIFIPIAEIPAIRLGWELELCCRHNIYVIFALGLYTRNHTMKKKVVFIINPKSGIGKKSIVEKEITTEIDTESIDFEIIYTKYRGHAKEIAERFSGKTDAIVAVGGDGTVNEIGSALVGSETALAIIPVGSGNGLARELNIPLRTSQAISVINNMHTRKIDVMKLNAYYSLNVAGVGFDSFISHKFSTAKRRGPLQYMRLITQEFPAYKSQEYTLNIDGHFFKRNAFLISFANSAQWGNNIRISPNAQVDDGLIDVCIVANFPNYAVPALLVSLLAQAIDKNKYDEIIHAKEVELMNEEPLLGHVDGEPIMIEPHSKISILPLSLNVVVPDEEFFKSSIFSPLREIIPQFQQFQQQISQFPFTKTKQ